ncbi:helix-turn-helix domain-containing protein [Mucilaginibacter sp. McL0603]|uniref:helix-turn-helix domain-containing protein n=1 Tax=Mucilaginibacter sp. McL0603 TaxID=3415670 RepID=UPI003CF22EBB
MTIADIAVTFKVTKTTVQNWIMRGTITGRKVGKNRYFTYDEVKQALGDYGWDKRLTGESWL